METISLSENLKKYQVYTGDINKNLKFFLEVSETIYGGNSKRTVLNQHYDNILFYSNLSERFTLKITQRPIDNGDQFIFLNLTNYMDNQQVIKFSLVFNNVTESKFSDFNQFYQQPEYSNRYGYNKLTTPSKYINTNVGSILMSKCIIYSDNNLYYHNQMKSITRKFHEESDETNVYNKRTSVHIETIIKLPSGKKSDLFFLISEGKLFSSEENFKEFFNDYSISIQNNDVRYNMWLTPHGSYTKLPYSIEPFDPDAYGINLHHMSKKEMFRYYKKTRDRFYYDMMYNAIIQLFGYRPTEKGLFLTDYTSTWLKKDYQISSPYIDTRLNETVSLAIEDFKTIFTFQELESYHLTYANFLVDYSKKGKLLMVNDQAYFFPDYFSLDEKSKPTHSSLNHQLGILNYLLNKYKLTKIKDYEVVLKALLSAIEVTKNNWIRENGDLYYKVFYKDGELFFDETDYIYVTLIDLLLVQENLLSIYGERNMAIHELIMSKMTYLQNNNYGLNDENALLPPNEDIASRKVAQKLAIKLHYLDETIN